MTTPPLPSLTGPLCVGPHELRPWPARPAATAAESRDTQPALGGVTEPGWGDRARLGWRESGSSQMGNKGKGTKPWKGEVGRQEGGTPPGGEASWGALPLESPIHFLTFAPGPGRDSPVLCCSLSQHLSCEACYVPASWALQRFARPRMGQEAPIAASGPSITPAKARLSAPSMGEIVLPSAW